MKTAYGMLLRDGEIAIIDEEDAHLLRLQWRLLRKPGGTPLYVVRSNGGIGPLPQFRHIPRYLHRAVTGAPPRTPVDHRSGDPLDNRRSNLLVAGHIINARNVAGANEHSATGVRGVTWHKKSAKWQAVIVVDGKLKYLGVYADIEDARRARAAAERELWGVEPRRAAELDLYAPA